MKKKKKYNNDPDKTYSFKGSSTHDFSTKTSKMLKKSSESLSKNKKSKKKKQEKKEFLGAKFDNKALQENAKIKSLFNKKKKKK